jgi:hypothetical protein
MIDFRLPENRREYFIRYAVWQLRTSDVDTANPVMNYIFDRNEYNIEQRYWMVKLYSITYDAASALALFNEMPDINLLDYDRIEMINQKYLKSLHIEKDLKWNRGHLTKIIMSYIELLNGNSQEEFFHNLCNSDSITNYHNIRNALISTYKTGRYSCWFWCQSLKECCNLNINPDRMYLGYDTETPTNGLIYALGMDDMLSKYYVNGVKRVKRNVKWDNDFLLTLENSAIEIVNEINSRFKDVHSDLFSLETSLCAWFKMSRYSQGRYPGYYLDRLLMNVNDSKKTFSGVDYSIITDFIFENDLDGLCNPKLIGAL